MHISVTGDKLIQAKLVKSGMNATVARSAFEQIAAELMRIIELTFQSQGRRGGGSWRFLKPETVRRKMRAGQDPRIMFATGALFRSLTRRGDPNQILEIGNEEMSLGSALDYAEIQHATRPLIKLTAYDKKRFDKIIADHVLGHWRGRRTLGVY